MEKVGDRKPHFQGTGPRRPAVAQHGAIARGPCAGRGRPWGWCTPTAVVVLCAALRDPSRAAGQPQPAAAAGRIVADPGRAPATPTSASLPRAVLAVVCAQRLECPTSTLRCRPWLGRTVSGTPCIYFTVGNKVG